MHSPPDLLSPEAEQRRVLLEFGPVRDSLVRYKAILLQCALDNWPLERNPYDGVTQPMRTDGIGLKKLLGDAADLFVHEMVTEHLATDIRRGLNLLNDGEA